MGGSSRGGRAIVMSHDMGGDSNRNSVLTLHTILAHYTPPKELFEAFFISNQRMGLL